MKLPTEVRGEAYGRAYQCVFGGLNEQLAARDGEICAMENMTGDHYPLLSPRSPRYLVRTLTAPHGMAAQDKLCWVDGTDFYYDGVVKGQVADSDKRFYFLNDWIVIWPDKLYYNTKTDEFGALEASLTVTGVVKKAHFISSAAPGGISSEANCLLLDSTTVQGVFFPGDGVTVSGCTAHGENNQTLVVREVVGSALYFYDNSFTLDTVLQYTVPAAGLAAGSYNAEFDGMFYHFALDAALSAGDTLVYSAAGTLTASSGGTAEELELEPGAFGQTWLDFESENNIGYAEPGAVTVSRSVPDMSYLCECDNRLWGVMGAEVYCSYLGNPMVWNNFDGTASCCWSVEVGSGGAFTGAFAYGGYPLLFKENHIYRLYGTKPATYQLMDTETLGCEAGSGKSFAVVGQSLYYKSRAGFTAYAGGVPALIDAALGTARRQNAAAGTDGRKYYVSVECGGQWSLYVYDTALELWHREDGLCVTDFAWCGGELYMLDADGSLWQTGRVRTPGGTEEAAVESRVEFADFYDGTAERKTLCRLYFRVQTAGRLTLSVQYDGAHGARSGGCSA